MNTVKIIPNTKAQFELAFKGLIEWRNETMQVSLDNKAKTSFAFIMNPAEFRISDTDMVSKK